MIIIIITIIIIIIITIKIKIIIIIMTVVIITRIQLIMETRSGRSRSSKVVQVLVENVVLVVEKR